MLGDGERFLTYLADERRAGRLYRALAELVEGERREALLELAAIEDKHAAHWEAKLREHGLDVPPDDGSLEPGDHELLRRARQMSLDAVLPDLESAEQDAQHVYDSEPFAAEGMADDERGHALRLADLRTTAPALVAERWHRGDRSGSARAAVFGVSDGLVSNTALVMGFAGSGISNSTVLFAGVAGLLAGAFSMAAGEYVSVASQRDLFRREIALEEAELRDNPEEEQRELELIYRAKGLDAETARRTAERIMANPQTALDTLAREELGLDPDELGSPVKVALASFAAFAIGATVPVLPYALLPGSAALVAAIVAAILAMLVVGGLVGVLSGRGPWLPALRQAAVGSGAAAVTYLVGTAVGVSL